MIERHYKCNLCRREFDHTDKELIPVEWKQGVIGEMLQKAEGPTYRVENHLCRKCIGEITIIHESFLSKPEDLHDINL